MELEKQDEIIRLLKKIEKNTAPPPKWKRVVYFIFTHLLTIIVIIITAYLVWKMYSLLGSVSDKVSSIREGVSELLTIPEKWKFWE
ncbi:MAG: hypothetical protein GWP15_02330 [Nitrospirae bacterium]|nr:hypothetical protein [Nitrospirota bacterium]